MLNVNQVRLRMFERGLTAKDVADTLNLSLSVASQKLNGIRPLNLDEAELLAELLEVEDQAFHTYFFAP